MIPRSPYCPAPPSGTGRLVAVCSAFVGLFAGGAARHEARAADPAAAAVGDAIFVPAADGTRVWREAVAVAGFNAPVIRIVEPDFSTIPGRAGVIETAWIEPPTFGLASWPPRRQRTVVRVVPTVGGAWVDAMVETQTLRGMAADGSGVELVGGWRAEPAADVITVQFVSQMSPAADLVAPLPPPGRTAPPPDGGQQPAFDVPSFVEPPVELPWSRSRVPRLSRAWSYVVEDYRNFYSCPNLVCVTAAFGAGALMANTGFDTTMQDAWQKGVEPTSLGTFFSDCKPGGEGYYFLPISGAAALTGLLFEGNPVGDVIGEWGSRSLRMFVVGAPPLYVLQLATGASRPNDHSSTGSGWKFFQDDNGVSGHAFVGALPFLAAADMVESPLLKGTLYVCSTFVAFSRITDNAHYPSQAFLGWYLAWASARAVDATEMHFANLEVRVVPLPMADLGGLAVEARW